MLRAAEILILQLQLMRDRGMNDGQDKTRRTAKKSPPVLWGGERSTEGGTYVYGWYIDEPRDEDGKETKQRMKSPSNKAQKQKEMLNTK